MPFIIPFVAALFAWGSMLNAEAGWINGALGAFGIQGPDWLNDPTWIYPALVVIGLWGIGSAIIINVAGLQNVPTELYDAARVDGAGFWGQLRHVTLPLMSPVIFYSITLGVVGVLQYFLVPLVLNSGNGRPAGSTYFFNVYIYNTFFTSGHVRRRDPRVVPVPGHHGVHAAPVLERAVLGLLRRGDEVDGRRSQPDRGPADLPSLTLERGATTTRRPRQTVDPSLVTFFAVILLAFPLAAAADVMTFR